MTNARASAARLVSEVTVAGRSLDRVLEEAVLSDRDRPLIRELVTGSLRHWYSLNDAIERGLSRPIRAKDHLLRSLLVVGAYQLRHTRIPRYAAVNETVAAAHLLGRTSAKGLVNQVLRQLSEPDPTIERSEPARYDHPQWLIDRLRRQFPAVWTEVVAENNRRAPMALRINRRRIDRERYRGLLQDAGVGCRTGQAAAALILDEPIRVSELPGYPDGWVSIQDEAAQLAVEVLKPANGERILDACAAPGGKALACLECADVTLLALDADATRCDVTRAEFLRLGFDPNWVQQGDATTLAWWDSHPFDRILLDAPCSGTGTLRRHPDIKLLKHEADLVAYRTTQGRLLATLWQTLRPGGTLLYCTCSILDEENDLAVNDFLAATGDARTLPIDATWGIATRCGRLILPTANGPDGFYYSLMAKA